MEVLALLLLPYVLYRLWRFTRNRNIWRDEHPDWRNW